MTQANPETQSRRETARHDDGTFGPHASRPSEAVIEPAEVLEPADDGAANVEAVPDLDDDGHHWPDPEPQTEPESDGGVDGEALASAVLDDANQHVRSHRSKRVRMGRTKWLRRIQMLTAIGTLKPARVAQAWRDSSRDKKLRRGEIDEEKYWQGVADDVRTNPEFFDPRQTQKPAGGFVSIWGAPRQDDGRLDG